MSAAPIDPQDRLFAVLDDRASVDRLVEALLALGIEPGAVEIFSGEAAADAFDGTGRVHGPLARMRRAVQFSLMDQMPDLAWYEAALREDRVVVGVRTAGRDRTTAVVAALIAAGGHFINRFGRLQTEEFVRWRGPEPGVHGLLRR
jgi:hypothetical protein